MSNTHTDYIASNHLKRVLLLLILSQAVFTSQLARAGGYEWGGLGSRAQSMGGAFVGLADDWTAIYWNPAGLTQLEGSGIGFEMASPHPVTTDKNSMSNIQAGQPRDTQYQRDTFAAYDPTEPAQFTNNTTKYDFYVPSGLAGYWQYKDWSMGAGFYVPVGYHTDWDDTILYNGGNSMISADLFQQLAIRAFNISLARPINNKLSFGAGFNLLYGSIDYEANKFGTSTAVGNYAWSMESDSDGVGYEGIFGLLYKATDKLSLGAVYRTGGTVNLEGDARSSLSFPVQLNQASDFRQKFVHPETLGLGLAYKAKPDLTLTADWNRTLWSSYRVDVNYKVEGALFSDTDYSGDWKDSDRYRCGFEYKPNKKWAFRAGYMFDKSPLRDKSVSLSHIVGLDRHNVTVGIGHQLKENLGLDLIYAYAWGHREIDGVDYRQRVNYFGLSLNYRF